MADVQFRCTPQVNSQYNQLLERLSWEDEWSDAYMELLEEIRCLPGFPHRYNWEVDTIVTVVVDVPRIGYVSSIGYR